MPESFIVASKGCRRCAMPIRIKGWIPVRRSKAMSPFEVSGYCSAACDKAVRTQSLIKKRLRAEAGMYKERTPGFRNQYAEFLPHAAPCNCKDCRNALARIRHRVDAGLPPDWMPTSKPCEGCGYSWTPHPRMHKRAQYCSTQCRSALKGDGSFPDSSRVHFIFCGECGVFLRVQAKHAPVVKCRPCKLRGQVDNNRRKSAKRRGARVGKPYRIAEIGDRDGWRCHLCHKAVDRMLPGMDPKGPTIDHLVPISRGGLDVRENVRLAHRSCNVKRRDGGSVQLLLMG